MNISIFSDTSCDLPENIKDKYKIQTIPFYVSFDKENYLRENIDITIQDFYSKLKTEKIIPKTSLPSTQDYISYFKPSLEDGNDIICFTLSSDFSGSYQSAINAREILLEDFPDRKIKIIDSRRATVAQGILVLQASRLKDLGYDIDTICDEIEKVINESLVIFSIDTLEYLQKGGRIGKVSALAGALLNIKPIIMLKDGILEPYSKVRGRKKVISELVNAFKEKLDLDKIEDYDIAIAHSERLDDALELKKQIEEKYNINFQYPILEIGVTVGAHIGGETLGFGFCKKPNLLK